MRSKIKNFIFYFSSYNFKIELHSVWLTIILIKQTKYDSKIIFYTRCFSLFKKKRKETVIIIITIIGLKITIG